MVTICHHPGVEPADRYEIGEALGEGGMGVVHRAYDRVLRKPVALKRLRASIAGEERFVRRFEQEQRFAAGLAHPNVVPVLDVGRWIDGSPFLTMRLAAGSLEDFDGDWAALRVAVDGLLAALGHLHARQVLHMDVKPANVLVDAGQAWLADLGLAGLRGHFEQGRVAGSPGFMAPEQREGRAWAYGPATDLFSVGVVLHSLGRSAGAPLALDALIDELLDPDPRCRPQLAADVRRALAGLDSEGAAPSTALPRGIAGPSTFDVFATYDAALPALEPESGPRRERVGVLPPDPPAPPSLALERASIALFAHRPLALRGRGAELATIWSLVRAVRDDGVARGLRIVGPEGSGRAQLRDTLTALLEEGGWAETVRDDDVLGGAFGGAWRGVVTLCVDDDDLDELVELMRCEALPALVIALASEERGSGDALEIVLHPLAREEIVSLLEQDLALAPDLAEALADSAGGSARFARETVMHWATQGLLQDVGGLRYGLAPGREVGAALPKRLAEVVDAQLRSLGAADELAALALAGRSVPNRVVERLSPSGLAEAVMRPGEPRAWRVEAWRRVAVGYATAGVHDRVARAWRDGDRPGRAGLHFGLAGEIEAAAEALTRHCEELGPVGVMEPEVCEMLQRIAADVPGLRVQAALWRARRERVDGRPADALAGLMAQPLEGFEVDWLVGSLLMDLARIGEAEAPLRAALAALDEDSPHRAIVQVLLARCAFQSGSQEQGRAWLVEALADAERSGSRLDRGWVRLTQAQARLANGQPPGADLVAAAQDFAACEDARGLAIVERTRGVHAVHEGHLEEGRAALELALRLLLRVRLDSAAHGIRIALADVDRRVGRFERARAMLLAGLRTAERDGDVIKEALACGGLVDLEADLGRRADAEAWLRRAAGAVTTSERPRWMRSELERLAARVAELA